MLHPRLSACLIAACVAVSAGAIQPQTWTHSTEADFEAGEADGVVVTNLGDLKLATSAEPVGEPPEGVTLIYDLLIVGETTYLAVGPEGRVLTLRDGEYEEVATFEGEQVFTLADGGDGRLLAGVSGEGLSRVVRLDGGGGGGGAATTVAVLPGERYVWDLLTVDGATYVATGTEGRVYRFDTLEAMTDEEVEAARPTTQPAGHGDDESAATQPGDDGGDGVEAATTQAEDGAGDGDEDGEGAVAGGGDNPDAELPEHVVLDTSQANVLCLAAGPDGEGVAVYAGTDTEGLIYRLAADGTVFIVYDAAEPEIGALAVAEDGTVYAGTADAEQARPGRLGEAAGEEAGRPAASPTEVDVDVDVEVAPAEPADPLPVEPDPQPLQAGGADTPAPSPADPAVEPSAPPAAPSADTSAPPAAADASGGDDTAAADASAPAKPTPEQYDALRDEIRERLVKARESGSIAGRPSASAAGATRPTRAAREATAASAGSTEGGNAVYRIDPRGFVSEVFRESVMVLNLAFDPQNHLLIATGNEGQLYRLDPDAGEVTVVNDLEPQQLLAVSAGGDGLMVAGSNPAAVYRLSPDTAASGTYTSPALDASQVSLWGSLRVTAAVPEGDSLTVETRSGNVADPELAGWSEWTDPQPLGTRDGASPYDPRQASVDAPPARFLQYRLTLGHGDDADAAATPTVNRVELAYVVPNLAPKLSSLTAAYPEFAGVDQPVSPAMSVTWEAQDPNADRLLYRLEYRPVEAEGYLPLAEDVTETSYEWDTQRTPDGRYVLQVTASDRLDNPGSMARTASRETDPVLVDNTPPTLEGLDVTVDGETATLSATVTDEFTPVRGVAYALDDAEQYEPVLPDDLIYDSTSESFSAIIPDLSPGSHTLTVRAIDARGNAVYQSRIFTVQ